MKVIKSSNSTISNIITEQQIDKSKKYRLLKFVHILPFESVVLFYNDLTKELLALDLEEHGHFQNYLSSGTLNGIAESLIKKWFLVHVDFNDFELSEQIKNFAKLFINKKGISMFTVFTTTTCNARCVYCFETNIKRIKMSDTTAFETARFIKSCHSDKVKIKWFGGEPLCNTRAIDIIVDELAKSNINFVSTMTSNGYLFDSNLVNKAKNKWNLQSVQITLDGLSETYNRIKNYTNRDNNHFLTVMNNIELLLKNKISVKIRLNMDLYNYSELKELIEYLRARYSKYNRIHIYLAVIYDNQENINERGEKERELLINKFRELTHLIYDCGMANSNKLSNTITTCYCIADTPDAVVILPDGKLCRCEEVKLFEDYFGTVNEHDHWHIWNQYNLPYEECYNCFLYPSCLRLKGCTAGDEKCNAFVRETRIFKCESEMKNTYLFSMKEDANEN